MHTGTLLVEARADPRVAGTLDAIAAAAGGLGYRVARWRGPFSGRVPHPRRLPPCRLAVLWNGTHPRYRGIVDRLRRGRVPILYAELGWHPQDRTFQLDPGGINSRASWAAAALSGPAGERLAAPRSGDLLVLLQNDRDTQLLVSSPWFEDMHAFVGHLQRHSALPLRIRPHPRHPPPDRVRALAEEAGMVWDRSATMEAALAGCRAVACINSSGALEALAHRLPVLCFGHAVYRQGGAVYCLDGDGERTRSAIREIAAGRPDLYLERVVEIVERVHAHQWTLGELPERLPPLLSRLLEPEPPPGGGPVRRPRFAPRRLRRVARAPAKDEVEPPLRLQRPLEDLATGREAKLGVVIPYRDRFEALGVCLRNVAPGPEAVFCVVSLGDGDPRVEELCRSRGVGYRLVPHDGEFQIGECMNHAAQHLPCRYLFTQDVDCLAPPGFYGRLLEAVAALDRERCPAAFLLIGCYYASEEFSRRRLGGQLSERTCAELLRQPEARETAGLVGSMPVVRRRHFLGLGGIDRRFVGHGAEDFFLLHQLDSVWQAVERPAGYPGEGKAAAGIRALAAAYRERSHEAGLFLLHRHHPRVPRRHPYRRLGEDNWKLLYRLVEAWDRRQVLAEEHPFIPEELQRAFRGEPVCPLPARRPDELESYLEKNDVRCVLLGNLKTLGREKLFQTATRAGVPAYCVERGPLEDSMFLDPNGFNLESTSYARDKWDHPLSPGEAAEIRAYVEACRASPAALEWQERRCPPAALREWLGLDGRERVLFVPLQLPDDTVIVHWSDWIESMAAFVALADRIARRTEWRVLVKPHPLDSRTYRPRRAQLVSAHFKDLLEVCDAVLTVNSGIGVQALMWQRPTLVAGLAFYQFDELNRKVGSYREIVRCLDAPQDPDPEAALRFLHYLRFRFCCDVRLERPDGNPRDRRTRRVRYERVRYLSPDWQLP